MFQVLPVAVVDREASEDKIEDRHCGSYAVVAPDYAGGLEPGEGEDFAELLGRYTELQADRDYGGESYTVLGASATFSAVQSHGSSVASSFCLVRPVTMRSSTSVSQASGST